jgi:hypothetical protein
MIRVRFLAWVEILLPATASKRLLGSPRIKRVSGTSLRRKCSRGVKLTTRFRLVLKLLKIKSGRLRWLGHLYRMQEQSPCRKLTLHKPEGTGRVGAPAIRWLDSIEEDLKIIGVRNWRRRTQDRDQWRAIVEEAKVHCGL